MFRLYDSAVASTVDALEAHQRSFSMYVCGPTVYDLPHVGHGRAVLTFDLVRRYLQWQGITVKHVSNITDIDDKILERAKSLGEDPGDLARRYEDEWWTSTDALGVLRPDQSPRATDWIPQMIDLIGQLLAQGDAYPTQDGVYLEVSRVPGYGLLAQQDLGELRAGARVNVGTFKRSSLDFALWKFDDGAAVSWDAPFGRGRPGWHTECVVMSLGILGENFDLHGGGLDLRFPHHENERAQAVAAKKGFARHWMHHGFVEVAGEKMSKSLGNFTTLPEMLNQYDPRAYRLLVARSHYRSPIEVTQELAEEASTTLRRLDRFGERMSEIPSSTGGQGGQLLEAFRVAMDDDMNTPVALGKVFETVSRANGHFDRGDYAEARSMADGVEDALGALGIFLRSAQEIPAEISELARQRQQAKEQKQFDVADELRATIERKGFKVEDSPRGPRVRPAPQA